MSPSNFDNQLAVCRKYGVDPVAAPLSLKVGIARNVREGCRPINGLRIRPEGDTSGWFIWAGEEWSSAPDFFVPLHIEHLKEWCPDVLQFLQLPPGARFLIADGYEDVWHDPDLLGEAEKKKAKNQI